MLTHLLKLQKDADRLSFDASAIARRVQQRLTPFETFAVFMNLGFLGLLVYFQVTGHYRPYDYGTYTAGARGDFYGYYYARWLLPVFALLDALPEWLGYGLWMLVNIAGLVLALRVFGGSLPPALLSYQMLYVLYYGQIVGVILGALAIFWWALVRGRWHLAGLALLIAATKYQIGLPFGIALWLLADITWRDRLRVLIVPAALALISLVAYPLWPLDALDNLRHNPPGDWGSVSLWDWMGLLSLLLWLPPLAPPSLLRLTPARRMILIVCATALAAPYYQQTDLLALFILPVGWLGWLGNLGYLYYWFTWDALSALAIVPALAYVSVLAAAWAESRRAPGGDSLSRQVAR